MKYEESTAKTCTECHGDFYDLVGCCSGYQCGCMGQPVGIRACKNCNKYGSKDIPKSLLKSCEYADKLEYCTNNIPDASKDFNKLPDCTWEFIYIDRYEIKFYLCDEYHSYKITNIWDTKTAELDANDPKANINLSDDIEFMNRHLYSLYDEIKGFFEDE